MLALAGGYAATAVCRPARRDSLVRYERFVLGAVECALKVF